VDSSEAEGGVARIFDVGKQPRADLWELGRSMRESMPRRSHLGWQPSPDRPDPIALLRRQEAGRVHELLPLRYGRMAVSPFTFYRGSAALMAWDLSRTPTTRVNVQSCGDAHAFNLGVYASPERRVVFDINDFDETLPAPWEWDVKRLAASVLLDTRAMSYPDASCAEMVRIAARAYCEVMGLLAELGTLEIHYAHVEEMRLLEEIEDPEVVAAIRSVTRKARKRTHLQAFRKFVTADGGGPLRFREDPPLLVRLPDGDAERFHDLFNRYRDTLPGNRRHLLAQYRFRDVARKVVGVGSVGLRAYAVLLEGRGAEDPLVLQVKEAVPSVLAPYVGRSQYERQGRRVVEGQRLMQAVSDPFLGWVPFGEGDYYVRQLRDMKGKTEDSISPKVYDASARLYGGTLARAHARSVDPALLAGYLGKGKPFVEAMVAFAVRYADQTACDYERLQSAIEDGEIPAASL
jgi:uncharacterized protein (DUF2252 family)